MMCVSFLITLTLTCLGKKGDGLGCFNIEVVLDL